jgi:glycosyltransferase involved in cell wall biosynthesis
MKYSIGIPAFKATYLKECIDSILSQKFTDFELIIVNDASPENLDEIVDSYSDNRIRYFKNQKNFGAEHVVDNWNKCLSYAKGEYFVLMGDDDLMEPNYLEHFEELIDSNPTIDIFHCRSYQIDEQSTKIGLTPVWAEFESVYDNILNRMQHGRLQYISDFVYKTITLRQNKGFYKLPLAWGSDDISSYIAMGNQGVVHTNTPLFCYRISSITISKSGSEKRKLIAYKSYEEWLFQFLKQVPNNLDDQLLRENIKVHFYPFFKRKRIITLKKSFSSKSLEMLIFWMRNLREYNLKLDEVIIAFFRFLFKK